MVHIFIKTFVLFFIFMSSSKAMEVTYSSDGKELNIPVIIDKASNKGYRVKMSHLYGDNLIFGVTELTEIPSFNKRFESILKNMTRKEVIDILGFPDAIYNKIKSELQYCSQPGDEVGVGAAYEQWNYGVDRYSEGSSGSVVFFSDLDSSSGEWTVNEAFHGYNCI